jgi:hypothetical protein
MQKMMRVFVIALATTGLVAISAPKDADAVSLNLVNVWEMGDAGGLLGGGGLGGGYLSDGPAWGKGAIPTQGINIHFGVGFAKGDQVLPYLGFSMVRVSYDISYVANGEDEEDVLDAIEPDDDGSTLQFGLQIGVKFFMIERAKGKAPPFMNIAFEKYIGSVIEDGDYRGPAAASFDPDADGDDNVDFLFHDQSLLSPTGFRFSFGAEYYFNDNFSLGGEFFGMKFHWSQGDNDRDISRRTIITRFALYTSLTLTYRFSFTVRASVQFESDYDYED